LLLQSLAAMLFYGNRAENVSALLDIDRKFNATYNAHFGGHRGPIHVSVLQSCNDWLHLILFCVNRSATLVSCLPHWSVLIRRFFLAVPLSRQMAAMAHPQGSPSGPFPSIQRTESGPMLHPDTMPHSQVVGLISMFSPAQELIGSYSTRTERPSESSSPTS
jgi:hypothetical protein